MKAGVALKLGALPIVLGVVRDEQRHVARNESRADVNEGREHEEEDDDSHYLNIPWVPWPS